MNSKAKSAKFILNFNYKSIIIIKLNNNNNKATKIATRGDRTQKAIYSLIICCQENYLLNKINKKNRLKIKEKAYQDTLKTNTASCLIKLLWYFRSRVILRENRKNNYFPRATLISFYVYQCIYMKYKFTNHSNIDIDSILSFNIFFLTIVKSQRLNYIFFEYLF